MPEQPLTINGNGMVIENSSLTGSGYFGGNTKLKNSSMRIKDGYIFDSAIIEESSVFGSVNMEYGTVQKGSTVSAASSTNFQTFTQAVAIAGGNVVNSTVSGYGLIQGLLSNSSFSGSYNSRFIAHINPGASVVSNSRYSGNAQVAGFVSEGRVTGHSSLRYRSFIKGSILGGEGACLFGIEGGIALFGRICGKRMARDEEGNIIIEDYPKPVEVGVMSRAVSAEMSYAEAEIMAYDKIEKSQLLGKEEYYKKTAELKAKRDLIIAKNRVETEEESQ